jgi:hypothetical protein
MKWVLPKTIRWPGWVIKVEVGDTGNTYGEWAVGDGSGGVIRLKRGLTKAQQKYALSHELIHAAIDYHHDMTEHML